MKHIITILFVLALFTTQIHGQEQKEIQLNSSLEKSLQVLVEKEDGYRFQIQLDHLNLNAKETDRGIFQQLNTKGLNKSFNAGYPGLPVWTKLIEIPMDAEVSVEVVSYDKELISLEEEGVAQQIIPAQPSISKSDDQGDRKLVINEKIYTRDAFYGEERVSFEDRGVMRYKRVGFVKVSPFEYNPVKNELIVYNNIQLEVRFKNVNSAEGAVAEQQYYSPYFESLDRFMVSSTTETKALIEDEPVKYVIVSDPMFETTLEPFVAWKKKKGFKVIEAYTDQPEVGNTTSSIKTYLQDLYLNPDDGIAPSFVLFVGDINQIPVYDGDAGSHVTDLYYCEYTGDLLPEVFYGRFSAESAEELQSQIDKTLQVEKYQMPDDSYLDEVVLVAGVDASWAPTHGNGAINYANEYYTNSGNGITSYYYLYGDGSGVMASDDSGASASIISKVSEGVGFGNYTAHCSEDGWADPEFSRSDIDGLANTDMYPLLVGNCCLSNKFDVDDCFGERILMAQNKGAVGYIGGSNNTYWDEDFYWGVGLVSTVTANPSYEESGLGVYDRFFHLNGESEDDWYVTQGQLFVGGNLAVEASSSSRKAYYWEIYHLMGDPSLTPYVTVPEQMTVNYPSEVFAGSTSLDVNTEENAYVALTKDGEIIDVAIADASGLAALTFDPLESMGELDIVITKQSREPHISTVSVVPGDEPALNVSSRTLNDASGNGDGLLNAGEAVTLSVDVENVSDSYDALNVEATLVASSDPHLTVTDDAETVGTVSGGATVSLTDAFSFGVDALAEDGQSFEFTLILDGEDSEGNVYQWTSKFSYTVHAGGLAFTGAMLIDDSSGGDGDGELEAGETAAIRMAVENTGSVDLSDVTGSLSMVGGSHPDVTLNTSSVGPISIASGTSETISYSVTLAGTAEKGDILPFKFEVTGGSLDQYSDVYVNEYKIPLDVYTIDQEGTHNVCDALFYDSGGAEGTYSNDEDYIITFVSSSPGEALTIDFKEFDVESNSTCSWDSLAIYDGLDVTSEQIGRYCGTSGPGLVTSTNIDNALTVVFHSDGSVTNPGWAAEIYCGTATTPQTHDITFIVSDSEGFLSGATVDFNGEQQVTNASGEALFTGVETSNDLPYSISATGYVGTSGTVTVYETASIPVLLENEVYDITINLYGDDGVTEVDGDVTLGTTTQTTVNGTTVFYNEPYGLSKSIDVSTTNCQPYSGTIDVDSDRSEDIVLTYIRHDVTFTVDDGTDPISGAIVEFDGQEQQTDATGATVFTDVIQTLGKEYTIRKSGYSNVTGSVDVTGDITEPVSMSAGQATFKVTFTVSDGTDPLSGAEVSFNSTLETTNSEGKVVFDGVVPANGMSYSVSKSGYDLYEGSLDVVDSNVEEPVVLVLTTHDITFSVSDGSSALEGASVTLDAVEQTTNASGETVFTDQLPASGVSFTVSMEGYADSTGTVDIDSDKTLDIALDIYTYDIVFEVSDKENGEAVEALVAFNDLEQASTEGSTTFAGVEYGKEMPYTVTASGYEDYAGSLNATSNLTEQVKLVPLTYNVTFAVEDAEGTALSGVAISFNEEELSTGSEGTAVFSSVRPGTGLAYTLTKSGYETKDGTLDVKDANVTETVTMSAATGIVDFADAGITVYPNPSTGQFELLTDNMEKISGARVIVYSLSGHRVFEGLINDNNTRVDLQNAAKGIYTIVLITNEGLNLQQKLIIQ